MKKVLLTGSTGFIGRNIKPLLETQYEVVFPTRSELDLRDSEAVAEYVRKGGFDVIVQSANPNPVKNSVHDTSEKMFEDSMRIFMNFYNIRRECGKLIYFGSGAEYGKNRDISMASEECINDYIPQDQYGLAKLYMNELARKSDNVYNFRIFGCYGPYDHESKFLTHVIRCCLRGENITIRQNCYFDYTLVFDLAKVISYFIDNEVKYHDYNVCSGVPVSLMEIAQKIKEQMGSRAEIVVLNQGLNKEYTADNSRLLKEMNNQNVFTSLDEGIKIQIEHEKRMLGL